ncbi:hypothetical protein DICVIV_13450 [Dictyocaulus viviparus]|uniref:Uncharacterized protein n=1 Tax=Dictyocaulus viviparus TaxID=29172 RepID=A0A0D8XAC5_DICVI|nr:hypothetical protein DICVIV_13450 [Dictyocaulus viviparus]
MTKETRLVVVQQKSVVVIAHCDTYLSYNGFLQLMHKYFNGLNASSLGLLTLRSQSISELSDLIDNGRIFPARVISLSNS